MFKTATILGMTVVRDEYKVTVIDTTGTQYTFESAIGFRRFMRAALEHTIDNSLLWASESGVPYPSALPKPDEHDLTVNKLLNRRGVA